MSDSEQDRGDNGRFIPGTAIWRERSSHGRAPIYDGPEPLWDACCQYFEWSSENPIYADTLVTFQGAAKHEPVAQLRAFTLKGLCLYIGISFETWRTWRDERPDLKETMRRVEDVIYTQKFEGAAAGLLNAGLITRDLGLADRREVDDVTPPARRAATNDERARAIAHILQQVITGKDLPNDA